MISSNIIYGASLEEWDAFSKLFGDAILPSVCDPTVQVSENSAIKSALKIPSLISKTGFAYGLGAWTTHKTTPAMVKAWSQDNRLGICANTRDIQAIDLDCATPELTASIAEYFAINISQSIPLRVGKAGRGTLLVRVESPEPLGKTVCKLKHDGGAIEFLGARQHTMLCGMHTSGVPYFWPDGYPTSVPTISLGHFAELWDELSAALGDGTTFNTSGVNERALGSALDSEDPFVKVLSDAGAIRSSTKTHVHIDCPWVDEHTDGIQGETSCSYLPPTTAQPANYVCLHNACKSRNVSHLHAHFGYSTAIADFADTALKPYGTPPEPVHWRHDPEWTRKLNKLGEPVIDTSEPANVQVALKYPELTGGLKLQHDNFKGTSTIWDTNLGPDGPGYKDLSAKHITRLRGALSTHPELRMKVSTSEMLEQVNLFLEDTGVDSGINAIECLPKWDGVERLRYYGRDILKAVNNSYVEDLGRYIFVAAVSRIIQYPIRVDGVPIFIGAQKCGKSRTISGMALMTDYYTDLTLGDNRADMYRQIAGKSIVGLDELAGMNRSEASSLKNFITQPYDEWTPKFSNDTKRQHRRCIFVGSTNVHRFLIDPTGNRRFMPVHVGITGLMDVAQQDKYREQYYAEALAIVKGNPNAVHDIYNRIDESEIANEAKLAATKISPAHKRIVDWLGAQDSIEIVCIHDMYHTVTGQTGVKEYLVAEVALSLTVLGYICMDDVSYVYKLKNIPLA